MKTKVTVGEKVFYVKKPGYRELSDGQLYAAKVFEKARKEEAILKSQLWDHLRKQGVWTDDKQKEVEDLAIKINEAVDELNKGKRGKFKKLTEAREAAIDIKVWRRQQTNLLADYKELEGYTIEGLADQGRFDFLVSVCVYNETGEKIFKSVDEYFDQSGEDWAKKCAEELSYLLYPNLDRNWAENLPENKFLLKYKFVDEKLRLVDQEGNLVDRKFHRIDEEGRYIDKDGNFVNLSGDKVDENGNKLEEFEEFDNDINGG